MTHTHTDTDPAFDSHHAICHKRLVTRTLLTRAQCLPTFYDSKQKGRQHVFSVNHNGSPKTFLRICCKLLRVTHQWTRYRLLVLRLFRTSVVLRNPPNEVWPTTTLKLSNNIFRSWTIFSLNPRIVHWGSNEPSLFILSLAETANCVNIEQAKSQWISSFINWFDKTKSRFGTRLKEHQKAVFLCKKENSALTEHTEVTCQTNDAIVCIVIGVIAVITKKSKIKRHAPITVWIGTGSINLEIKTDYLQNLNFWFTSIVVTRGFDLSTRQDFYPVMLFISIIWLWPTVFAEPHQTFVAFLNSFILKV